MRCRLSLGLEELSIRWIQLHRAAGGDMVLMGSSPLRWRLSEGLEELSIRGFQLHRASRRRYGSMGGSPCGGG